MNIRRWLPVLVLGATLGVTAGISACADGELNPQPLPPGPVDEPGNGTKNGESQEPTTGGASSGFSASSGGSSGGVGATPDNSADAGANPPADAGDAGDAGAK